MPPTVVNPANPPTSPSPAGASTPGNRATRILLDVTEQQVQEHYWSRVRKAAQIAPLAAKTLGADGLGAQGVRYWSSGCWTMRPYQERFASITERLPPGALSDKEWRYWFSGDAEILPNYLKIIMVAGFEHLAYGRSVGIGLVHDPSTVAKGDPLIRKSVGANVPWDFDALPVYPPAPQQTTVVGPGVQPPFASPSLPLDTIAYSDVVAPADQGFCLRWLCPSNPFSSRDYILNFHFGGGYALLIRGDGLAQLVEWCRPKGNAGTGGVPGAYRWVLRATFRYAPVSSVFQTQHTLLIFPHLGPNGEKYIAFSGTAVEAAAAGASPMTMGALVAGPPSLQEYLYTADELTRFGDVDEAPGHVTRPGIVRLDIRRDLRVAWHFSRLIWENYGYVGDAAWGAPTLTSAGTPAAPNPYVVSPVTTVTGGQEPGDSFDRGNPTVTPVVRDAFTGSTANVRVPQVTLTFSPATENGTRGYGRRTPVLWGYRLTRPERVILSNPGRLEARVQSVAIRDAQGPDPRTESGEVILHGPLGELSRLNNRGELSAKLVTTFTPASGLGAGTPQKVTLLRGYAKRPRSIRHGRTGSKSYPDWREYSVLLEGMALRLSEFSSPLFSWQEFAIDPNATVDAFGFPQAWKVTDVIRYLLKKVGFPDSMIAVDDNPVIRLFTGFGADRGELRFNANTEIGSLLVSLARNYLGGYLVFDCNAGSAIDTDGYPEGAWRIVYPYREGASPLLNFANAPGDVPEGVVVIPHVPGAYPADPITGAPSTFENGLAVEYVVAPEHNHLWVCCPAFGVGETGWRIENHWFNMRSYAVPGSSVTPDPNSEHYIGREKLCMVIDLSLFVPGPDSFRKTQLAVDLVGRRIFNFAGRARRIRPLHAPLYLISDPDTGKRRPLRYGDPVSLDGDLGWFVRSVVPDYRLDHHQMARYEVERLVPL